MQYALKNDDGIECHFDLQERELLFDALRHYSAHGSNERIVEQVPKICEIMNVLHLPEFDKRV